MKHKIIVNFSGAMAVALLFSGCITKSNYTVRAPEKLDGYGKAIVRTMTESAAVENELEAQLTETLGTAELTVLKEIPSVKDILAGEILLAEYDIEEHGMETIVNIAYSDYVSGEELAFCRGTWGLKGKEKNLAFSQDNAIKQTRYLFGLADESEEFNKYGWY